MFCPTGAKKYAPLGGFRPSNCDVAVMSQWSDTTGPISIIDTFDISGKICLMRVSDITLNLLGLGLVLGAKIPENVVDQMIEVS